MDVEGKESSPPTRALDVGVSALLERKPRPDVVRVDGTHGKDEEAESRKSMVGEV